MICSTCHSEANRIIVLSDDTEGCPNCLDIKETGGPKIDGILTRNSFRVREESVMYEKDFILPHTWDKMAKKYVPNRDFVERYGVMAHKHYTPEELNKVGYTKAADKVVLSNRVEQAHHKSLQGATPTGDEMRAVEKLTKALTKKKR